MANLFAVIAETTDYESVLDSLWEEREQANSRRDKIWEYPTVFRAAVKRYPLNGVDENILAYELARDLYEEVYDEW